MISDWNGSISATTHPIATINTSIQRSIHCASNREKRGEKALQTSEIHGKTWRKASCRLSKTKRDRSRSVEQLRSSFFLRWKGLFVLVTSSIESKAIHVTITTENGYSLRDAGPRPRIDRKSERFSLSWWASNERYSSSSRRIFTNKASPFRLGKDLFIGTFLFKIRAKMISQRCFKAIDDYPSKFDWPGIKGLRNKRCTLSSPITTNKLGTCARAFDVTNLRDWKSTCGYREESSYTHKITDRQWS